MEPTTLAEGDNSPTTPAAIEQQKKDVNFRDMYYREYGQRKTLEKDFTSFKEEVKGFMANHQSVNAESEAVSELIRNGYDEEEAKKLVKANQLINKGKSQGYNPSSAPSLEADPERDVFLQKHPEAYQFIDEIDNAKKLFPSRKYDTIATTMGYVESPTETIQTFQTSGNQGTGQGGGTPQLTKEQEDELYEQEVNKFLGRIR